MDEKTENTDSIRHLTPFEMSILLRWFLYYMPMEQRRRLMAEFPVYYKMMFPNVSEDTLSFQVRNRFAELPSSDLIPDQGPRIKYY